MTAKFIVNLHRQSSVTEREGGDQFPVLVLIEQHPHWGTAWLAQVTGVDEEAAGGFVQEFVEPKTDLLSPAKNGAVLYEITRDGIYQAQSVWQSYELHRTVFVVKEGAITIIAESSKGDTVAKIRNELYILLTGAKKPRKVRAKKEAVAV